MEKEKPPELKAEYYGEINLIGVKTDAYVLNDGRAVMSERGFADLLGIDKKSMGGNYPPENLEAFCEKGLTIEIKEEHNISFFI